MTTDAEPSLENKNELISAWVRDETAAGGERIEVAWDLEQTLWIVRDGSPNSKLHSRYTGVKRRPKSAKTTK